MMRHAPENARIRSSSIPRFPVPDISALPEDLRTHIEILQENMGFIPNVFLGHAYRPNQLRAFPTLHDDLMKSGEGLNRAERDDRGGDQQWQPVPVLHRLPWYPIETAMAVGPGRPQLPGSGKQRSPAEMLDYAAKFAQTPWLKVRRTSASGSRAASPGPNLGYRSHYCTVRHVQ